MDNYMNTKTRTKGFTLVETLVSLAILTLAVTGAFSAAQSGISSSVFSKDQVIAFYLGGEGVEQIRNLRDENALNSRNWLTGIASSANDPCYFSNACTVDVVNETPLEPCSGGLGTCKILQQDPVNGFYGYSSGWTNTIFKREILITPINADEVSILVRVTWSKGLITRTFDIRENIFNWQ